MTDPEGATHLLVHPGDMEPNKNHKPIFTAVVIPLKQDEMSWGETSSFSELSVEGEERKETETFPHFKSFSLLLGLLVGFFIQFSSLGANFLLTNLDGPNENHEGLVASRQRVIIFSLCWSFFTSTMGVLILLFLRNLINLASREVISWTFQDRSILNIECFFAVGALLGVCVAWTCTDILLGFNAHIYHSLLTLIVALVWCKVVTYCYEGTAASQTESKLTQLSEPLLEKDGLDDAISLQWHFKCSSMALGLLIGFFIQFSSLGANFLLYTLNEHTPTWSISKEKTIVFSLVWSFVTSAMGVAILICMRSLVIMTSSVVQHSLTEKLVVHMECFFALGALIGVNIAWIATDTFLGMQSHILYSLATLLVALLWFELVMRIFGYRQATREDLNQREMGISIV